MDISKKFNFKSLLIFALPSVIMMVFQSLYTVVDGSFVSTFVSTDALSSINISWPIIGINYAFSIMFGVGGSAIVAKKLGEGKKLEAKSLFTMFFVVNILVNIVYVFLSLTFIDQILVFLGIDEKTANFSYTYATIMIGFSIFTSCQNFFQAFFVTASKPKFGLSLIMVAGILNIVLDYIFLKFFNMGIAGAAYATVIGQTIPTIGGLIFFMNKKRSISFTKFKFDYASLFKGISNGSSEMVISLSGSIMTFLFNVIMLRLGGSDLVASISTIQYMQFFFVSVFLGFSIGIQPIVSYNYGNEDKEYLKKLYFMSLKFILISGIVMSLFAFFSSPVVAYFYAKNNMIVYDHIVVGLRLYSIGVVFSGVNILYSGFFTALNNGVISATISFLRAFVFISLTTIIMSYLFGINGVFLSLAVAEGLSLIVSVLYTKRLFKYFR